MGKEDEVELLLETRLEAGLVGIQAELVSHFLDLAPMLNEAFELHHNGKYFGSVALFLSISEGIGRRIFQASPLSKAQLKKIEEWIRSRWPDDLLFGWFLTTISEVLPMCLILVDSTNIPTAPGGAVKSSTPGGSRHLATPIS